MPLILNLKCRLPPTNRWKHPNGKLVTKTQKERRTVPARSQRNMKEEPTRFKFSTVLKNCIKLI